MRLMTFYFLFIVAIIALYGVAFAQVADEPAGKTVFLNAKCANCHGVEAAGIEAKAKKKSVPDLSLVSTRHSEDFLKKYITKQEKLNDANHPVAFKGSEEELAQMIQWFVSLNAAAPKQEETPAPSNDAKPQKH